MHLRQSLQHPLRGTQPQCWNAQLKQARSQQRRSGAQTTEQGKRWWRCFDTGRPTYAVPTNARTADIKCSYLMSCLRSWRLRSSRNTRSDNPATGARRARNDMRPTMCPRAAPSTATRGSHGRFVCPSSRSTSTRYSRVNAFPHACDGGRAHCPRPIA